MWRRIDECWQSLLVRDEAYWSMLLQRETEADLPVVFVGNDGQVLVYEGVREAEGRCYEPRPLDPEELECWKRLEECLHSTQVLTVQAIGYNRGGLLVRVDGLQGFVPSSQIAGIPRSLSEDERAGLMAEYVGRELKCRVIELDPTRNRIILSERAATPDGLQGERLLETLREGHTCAGRISNIRPFGAFVDLGGIEGLIHISELSWRRIEDPSEVVHLGQEVATYVLSVDKERRRVGLSLKRLEPDPWDNVDERYRVGQVVEGTVTKVLDFGFFAQIADGVEGLVHVSEMEVGRMEHPGEVVAEGDRVRVRVLHIDRENRRLGLSMIGV